MYHEWIYMTNGFKKWTVYRVSRSGRQRVLRERRLRRRCHVDHQVRSAIRRRRFRGLGHDLLPGSRVYHLIELPSISHTHNETFGIVRQMCSSLIKVPIQSSSHFSDMSIQSTNMNSRTTPTASTATSANHYHRLQVHVTRTKSVSLSRMSGTRNVWTSSPNPLIPSSPRRSSDPRVRAFRPTPTSEHDSPNQVRVHYSLHLNGCSQ